MNSTGKAARRQSGLNRFGLKKRARVKKEEKRYADYVLSREKYNAMKAQS